MTRRWQGEAAAYGLAAAGAGLALWLTLPLALLIGPVVTLSILSQRFPALHVSPAVYGVGLMAIGAALGQYFTPEIVSTWATIGTTLAFNAAMTLAGLTVGFVFLTRVLGYNAATAAFAGLPGGILTVLEVSKDSDADLGAVLFFQVFRIILGATMMPLAYALSGFNVPSMGVQAVASPAPVTLHDAAILIVASVAAAVLGRRIRFPSAEISAPLLVSAVLYGTGVVQMTIPTWVPALGFVVVGASIGTLLPRPGARKLVRLVLHTAALFCLFVALTLGVAVVAHRLLGIPFPVGILTFSPASLTEMIALSVALDLDPAMVAANNMFRMIFCSLLAPGLLVLLHRAARTA
ncbi:MAG: AbrB family transcriptional regulator [Rhodobacteraceae bacterium]|nr:AbrB family transcriptional regulator [Paracoccaceae bacterium]